MLGALSFAAPSAPTSPLSRVCSPCARTLSTLKPSFSRRFHVHGHVHGRVRVVPSFDTETGGALRKQCYGHRGSDIFPYGILSDLITPQFTFYGQKAENTLQNRALMKLFDPKENALPFIYDNFDWSHCSDLVSEATRRWIPPFKSSAGTCFFFIFVASLSQCNDQSAWT